MGLTTSLAGRVRNTNLPKSHSLLPLLEAIVNGLQAIDVRFGDEMGRGRLRVTISGAGRRSSSCNPPVPGRAALKPITGFLVEDNGVGFTPDNMDSFETLDTDYKASLGCRGVGRLLWLKAFDKVSVRSAYMAEDGQLPHASSSSPSPARLSTVKLPTTLAKPEPLFIWMDSRRPSRRTLLSQLMRSPARSLNTASGTSCGRVAHLTSLSSTRGGLAQPADGGVRLLRVALDHGRG